MNHRPKEIVLTGGPCSWKTGGLKFLKNELLKHGFRPFLVPETATMIIGGGVPDIVDIQKNNLKKYVEVEKNMLLMHLALRKEFCRLAQNFDNSVIIYDRGGMDQAAYMPKNYFDAVLEEEGLTLHDVRDSYDKVIHLVTAAYGAEASYTIENNEARQETTVEKARKVDDKTLQVWVGHPHLSIIPTFANINDKAQRLLGVVLHSLGIPEPYEIERKFLLKRPPSFTEFESCNAQKIFLEQMYLRKPGGRKFRIRKHQAGDLSATYFKTNKSFVRPDVKIENEEFIDSPVEYLRYREFKIPNTGVVWKHRWYFVYKYQYFELDVFVRPEGLCLLEIELLNENDPVELPPFLEIEREVTGEKEYSNYEIAKRIA